ncbi:MAG: HEPN domain-containing protein [Armatimonadetes bacterium]|nr:HEPN domain-containing protein [Armatimonadota bacterium]
MQIDQVFGNDSATDWLRYARSDLAVAIESHSPKVLLAALCFHAQQSVERSIKAVLVRRRVHFPFTHNIGDLVEILRRSGIPVPAELEESGAPRSYTEECLYPGYPEVTDSDYRKAIQVAEKVLAWAEQMIETDD